MELKLLRDKKDHIVGMRIDDKAFFFSMNNYPLGPEAYLDETLQVYTTWLRASQEQIAQYGRGLGHVESLYDREMEVSDPNPDLLHRIGHTIDKSDGEFDHEEFMRDIQEREGIYENGIEVVDTIIDVLNKRKNYFRGKINQGNFNANIVEKLKQCITLTGQIIDNYRFARELGQDVADMHGKLYSGIEDHID